MPTVSILTGLILAAVGGYYFHLSEYKAMTALIPAYIGAALAICGIVALKEKFLKHAMHAAAMVGLLAFLATAGMGVPGFLKMQNGDETVRPNAVYLQLITAAVCLVFVGLCVNSFIQVRRARKAAEARAAQG